MKFSLSIKINAIIILVTTMILLFFGAYEWVQTKAKLTDELNLSLENSSQRLADSLAYPIWTVNKSSMKEFIEVEMRNEDMYAVIVRNSLYDVLAGQVRDANWQLTDFNQKNFISTPLSKISPIIRENENLGTVEIYLTDKFMNQQLSQNISNLFIRLIVMLLLIVITLATLVQVTITHPLKQLTEVFDIIAGGNLDQPIDVSRTDEIGQLAKSFAYLRDEIRNKISSLNEEIQERQHAEVELKWALLMMAMPLRLV